MYTWIQDDTKIELQFVKCSTLNVRNICIRVTGLMLNYFKWTTCVSSRYFLVDTLSWYLFDFSSRYFVQLKWQRTLKSNRQSIVLNKGELCTVVEFKETLTMLYYKDKYWHFGFLLSLPSSWRIRSRCHKIILMISTFLWYSKFIWCILWMILAKNLTNATYL